MLAVLSGHASTQAAPPDKQHQVQLGPSHTLKLWFNPKYGWRAKSYDRRYPGCTRQQEHRVYTADDFSLPDLLRNPNNLHWLSDPEQAGGKALYIGQLGLAGGMPPSKRVNTQARNDLNAIVIQATEQGKMDDLQRVLSQAREGADFDGVYEEVFGEGSSEKSDLAIFDLMVGEVRALSNYSAFFSVGGLVQHEEKSKDAEDDSVVRGKDEATLSPDDLVQGLYAPAESEKHQAACTVLKSKKYEAAYSKVLPLTAGLLYKQYVDGKDAKAHGLHMFWVCVLSDPRELVGNGQMVLNMRCMEACGADIKGVLGKLHKPILDDITSWLLAGLSLEAEKDLTPALQDVWGACPCVLSYEPLVKGMLAKLKEWTNLAELPKKAALGMLVKLGRLVDAAWPPAVSKVLLECALSGCKHESEEVRQVAACSKSKGLKQQCSGEDWKGIVEVLKDLCNDGDPKVREAAVLGLSKVLEGVPEEG